MRVDLSLGPGLVSRIDGVEDGDEGAVEGGRSGQGVEAVPGLDELEGDDDQDLAAMAMSLSRRPASTIWLSST